MYSQADHKSNDHYEWERGFCKAFFQILKTSRVHCSRNFSLSVLKSIDTITTVEIMMTAVCNSSKLFSGSHTVATTVAYWSISSLCIFQCASHGERLRESPLSTRNNTLRVSKDHILKMDQGKGMVLKSWKGLVATQMVVTMTCPIFDR